MKSSLFISGIFILIANFAFSQGFNDTIISIKEINIQAKYIFEKEEAGVKSLRIDTLILMDKINASVSDVLAQNTSVHIKDYGRGAMATASFRGTASTHTQVSWNGLKINSPMLGMVDFSLIPVYIIDDMSLQHGAASLVKQSGGIGGHISMDNTVDWANNFGGKIYSSFASFNSSDFFGQINFGSRKVQAKTRVYRSHSDNNYSFINKHKPISNSPGGDIYFESEENKNAAFGKSGLAQEFYLKTKNNIILSSKSWYQQAHRSIPSVLSDESNDSGVEKINKQNDQTFKTVAEAKFYLDKFKLIARTGADYQSLDYVSKKKNPGIESINQVNSGSEMVTWSNQVTLSYHFNEKLSATFYTDINRIQISTLDTVSTLGYNKKRFETANFFALAYQPLNKLNVNVSLRKDWVPKSSSPLIYSLGTSYKPGVNNLILKTNISRNYHQPTLNDLYWQPGGNPDLKPEKGYTLESGIHFLTNTDRLNFSAELTGFYTLIDDWILWLPDVKGYWQPLNLAQVKSMGTEIHAQIHASFKKTYLTANTNYTFTKTENQKPLIEDDAYSAKQQLPYVPKHAGNLFISVQNRGYFINFQYSFYGIRNTLNSNLENRNDDSEFFGFTPYENPYFQMYAHHIKNMSMGKNLSLTKSQIAIELKINNIFNETYRNVLNRFMPGRNYCLSAKYSF